MNKLQSLLFSGAQRQENLSLHSQVPLEVQVMSLVSLLDLNSSFYPPHVQGPAVRAAGGAREQLQALPWHCVLARLWLRWTQLCV